MIDSIRTWFARLYHHPGARALALVDTDVREVERALAAVDSYEAPLAADVVKHLSGAGGKRLRPALVFLCYGAAGGKNFEEAIPYATAAELVHTATLLHDDVIDDGETRRGRTTANVQYDNTSSVLAGDFVLATVMMDLLQLPIVEPARHISVALRRLVEGEFLQREYAGRVDLREEQYLQVARLKTSSLFSYAAWAGGFLVNQDEKVANRFARFAENLGAAFQIADDVLDFQSEETGKTPLADLKEGKMSLPIILALQERPELQKRIADLFEQPETPGDDELAEISAQIKSTNALTAARDRAREFSSLARAALAAGPDNAYKQSLEDICRYVVERSK